MADSRELKSNPEEAVGEEEEDEEGETAACSGGFRGCNRNLKRRLNEAIGVFPNEETVNAIILLQKILKKNSILNKPRIR